MVNNLSYLEHTSKVNTDDKSVKAKKAKDLYAEKLAIQESKQYDPDCDEYWEKN